MPLPISDNPTDIRLLIDGLQRDLSHKLNRGDKEIHLDSPYYLYLTDKQAESYLLATLEDVYQSTLDHPLREIIYKNKAALTSCTQSTVHFYDLGPGYPNKSVVLLNELLATGRRIQYVAIDISSYFLALTREIICRRGIPVTTLRCLFEEAHTSLPCYGHDRNSSRFLFIGTTFNNYSIDSIIHILTDLCRADDIVVIAAQFFDGLTPQSVTAPYRTSASETFNFLPLDLLGFDRTSFQYFIKFLDSCIHMGFIATSDIPWPNGVVPRNTRIFTSFSYRYTKSYLKTHITPFRCESVFSNNRHDIGVIKLRKE